MWNMVLGNMIPSPSKWSSIILCFNHTTRTSQPGLDQLLPACSALGACPRGDGGSGQTPSQHPLATRSELLPTNTQHHHKGNWSKVKLVVGDGGVTTVVRKCLWHSGAGCLVRVLWQDKMKMIKNHLQLFLRLVLGLFYLWLTLFYPDPGTSRIDF